MADIQGMFGQNPAMVQQAIQQQQQAGYTNTQPSMFQLAQQGGNQAGGMLGNALGTATGYQDPRMAEAQLGQQVQQKVIEQAKMQGIDPVGNPEEFIKLVAQGWMEAGKPDKAYAAVNTLQQMQAQKSKMGLEAAETQAKLREKQFVNVPKGGSIFDIKTGTYSSAPTSSSVSPQIDNQWDAMDFLNQVNEERQSGKELPPGVLNKARAVYEMLNKPQVGPNGVMVAPPDITHLNPSVGVTSSEAIKPDPNMPDYNEVIYLQNLVDKGVPEATAIAAVRKMKTSGKLPQINQQQGNSVFGREVQEVPSIVKTRDQKAARDLENTMKDDYTKALDKPSLVLDTTERMQNLLKDPKNATNLQAVKMSTVHLLEPTNQALKGEITSMVGGGDIAQQVLNMVNGWVEGTPNKTQMDWLKRYIEDMKGTALSQYKGIARSYEDMADTYKKDYPEFKKELVINARKLSRLENVPFVDNNEDYAKLPKGTEFYAPGSVKKRIKQ